jgi:hypothetical protein
MAFLQPGDPIEHYRIQRNSTVDVEDGVYVMSFASYGRRLCCPLVRFQARTASVVPEMVEESPARESAAVS